MKLCLFGLQCRTECEAVLQCKLYSVCVREIEFLTGRELTNEVRPILVNSLCVFRQLSSEFRAEVL
jgi:hypothetical protein